MAKDWFWFEDKGGAAGDNIFASNNWDDGINNPGNWGTPGVGDGALMETDYGGTAGGCDTDCTIDADVTVAHVSQNIPAGNPYQGTLTIAATKTLTVTTCEFESDVVHDGAIDAGDFQSFASHTGAGGINVSGEVNMSSGVDWSGYTGTFTFDGGGSEVITGSSGPPLALPDDVVIDGAGTLTFEKDATCAAITMAAGTLALDTYALTIGDLSGTGGTFALDSGALVISGTFDGDNITFTNTAGIANGGTMDNVDLTGEVPLLHFGAPGSGNTNVLNPSPYQWAKRHRGAA